MELVNEVRVSCVVVVTLLEYNLKQYICRMPTPNMSPKCTMQNSRVDERLQNQESNETLLII